MSEDLSEEIVKIKIGLERDQVDALSEIAAEYSERLGQGWDIDAVVRVAVGDFITKLGRMA